MYASLHAEKDSLIAFVDTRENRTGFTPGLKSRRNDRLKADYFMSAFNRIGTLLVFGARATLLSSLFTWSQPPIAPAQISLAYGHRSNPDRQEGLIQPETSGRLSVRLVSAEMLFDAFEATQSDQIHVRFLLQKPCEATISVRELQPYHLYAMDASVPETVAHTGWNNEFAWPTREVLKALPICKIKTSSAWSSGLAKPPWTKPLPQRFSITLSYQIRYRNIFSDLYQRWIRRSNMRSSQMVRPCLFFPGLCPALGAVLLFLRFGTVKGPQRDFTGW